MKLTKKFYFVNDENLTRRRVKKITSTSIVKIHASFIYWSCFITKLS